MQEIIAVVGPTASGKTGFALKIAQRFLTQHSKSNYSGVDLISVDSRQIYQGLEILSGADVPDYFSRVPSNEVDNFAYYKHKTAPITLHGISIINFDQDWSVAHFKDFATQIICNSFRNNRLVILVGGTGLYHQHLFSTDSNLYIPPNQKVRAAAEEMSLGELQKWLETIHKEKFLSLNNSDKNNPRRLVRAIEIATGTSTDETAQLPENITVTTYGMQLSLAEVEQKIMQRVEQRFCTGVVSEAENLSKICLIKDLTVCSTLGLQELTDFIAGRIDAEQCKVNWALREYQYAKRQLTWFKRRTDIIWLDDLQKKQYTAN